jgi:hypothetical protein
MSENNNKNFSINILPTNRRIINVIENVIIEHFNGSGINEYNIETPCIVKGIDKLIDFVNLTGIKNIDDIVNFSDVLLTDKKDNNRRQSYGSIKIIILDIIYTISKFYDICVNYHKKIKVHNPNRYTPLSMDKFCKTICESVPSIYKNIYDLMVVFNSIINIKCSGNSITIYNLYDIQSKVFLIKCDIISLIKMISHFEINSTANIYEHKRLLFRDYDTQKYINTKILIKNIHIL